MIFVTVGTDEHPFDRLVAAAERLAVEGGEAVVLQRGYSREPAPSCEVHDLLPHGEIERMMDRARVVVTHAGPASVLLARARGHVPLVVPRDPAHGEHVDDHQLRFARGIADQVHLVIDPGHLATALTDHDRIARGRGAPASQADRSSAFAMELGRHVNALVARSRARGRLRRATLAILSGRGPTRR